MVHCRRTCAVALALLLALAAVPAQLFAMGERPAATPAQAAAPAAAPQAEQPRLKYVFLFIGDGMAMTQINAAEIFARAMSGGTAANGISRLGFTQFPVSGLTTTYDHGSFITDSASAGTAIATGNKTLSGVINMDPGKTQSYTTIAEMARDAGFRVGVVSNVSIDHATPASFYAHVPSRSNMYDIAVQLTRSNFDYFGGGGFAQPTGRNRDQPNVIDLARAAGYTYVNDVAAFRALQPGAGRVIAVNPTLQDSSAMPYEIDRAAEDLGLEDYVAKGIELLDNERGFFMMVESGKIDWACHANDAAASLWDTLAFDRAIAEAVEFYLAHPEDTLILVTGDHETGGMSLGFAGTRYDTFYNQIGRQRGSYVRFDSEVLGPYKAATPRDRARLADLWPRVEEFFGLRWADLAVHEREQLERAFLRSMGNELERAVQEEAYLLYGGYEPFTVNVCHVVNQRAGIGWTSYSHTGVPVATFAMGHGADRFGGYYDNTDIFRRLSALMGLTARASR